MLDSAKAIARPAHIIMGTSGIYSLVKASFPLLLPLFAILTLAATGSEMNPYAVVTMKKPSEKLSIGNDYTRPVVSY